jgi:hypothetical protein
VTFRAIAFAVMLAIIAVLTMLAMSAGSAHFQDRIEPVRIDDLPLDEVGEP